MKVISIGSLSETEQWAKELAKTFNRPCLVLLNGDLGAGKTQLVRWFVEALGGTVASSPTFAIHQSYESPGGNVDHVDLYRLESAADLDSAGVWDLLAQPNALIFIEWAERIPNEMWPKNFKQVRIRVNSVVAEPEARSIELSD